MRRIRVMILLNSLVPYGAENFVLNHARFADRKRFDIVVAHLGGAVVLADRFKEIGIETVDLARGGRRYVPQTLVRLAIELRRRRIDILQTHIALAGVVGALIGRAARVPTIVITEQNPLRTYPALLRAGNRLTFRLAHAHVYISRAVLADFASTFPDADSPPVSIITNGIDVRAIARTAHAARDEVRAELGLASDEIALGNVGRLTDQKGQRYAITAFVKVRNRWPKTSLWIVGSGELKDELEKLAADEGVAEAVHFLGQRMDVHRLLGGFDIYVHPAVYEGLGIAVLEAMAAELPVVASAVDAIPEYVKDGETGTLVPPRDVSALSDAIAAQLADPMRARRLASAGRELVEREHDIRAAVRSYEALYERLFEAHP